jgi:hypothetical protein
MRIIKTFLLLFTSVLFLASCSEVFTFNLFETVDNAPTPSASKYSGTDGLDLLAKDLASKAVVKALTASPSVVADIETMLIAKIGGTVDFGDDQRAATLLADLYLKTTGGEQFVNNFYSEIFTLLSSAATSTLLLSTALTNNTPTEAKANLTTFTAFIQGLLDANGEYLAFGNGITDTNSSGGLDNGDVASGVNVGDAAEKAIIAFTIRMAVEDVKTLHGGGATDSDAMGEMYNLMTGGAVSADVDTLTINNISNPTIDIAHASSDTYLASNGPDLLNIVECAGFSI